MAISRRALIGRAAAGGALVAGGASLWHLRPRYGPEGALGPQAAPRVGTWEDLYRQKWTWDRVAKGAHGWLNCRSACSFDLYVKDGVVVREEQAATYAASEPGVPDFNPRGCQKGACYTEVMYGPSRLTQPLKRVGERGSGQWQTISWEQALDEIAVKLCDIAVRDGSDAVIHDLGPHFDQGATTAARTRFFLHYGAAISDSWAEIGDLNAGAALTFGFPHAGGSSDEWFLSDFLVVWMMNPSVTQMPDAHFLFEARYRGATLVTVDPVYSATTIHADVWLPLQPGSDAALALAVARHIWTNDLVDVPYVREQTDLPVLVRDDTSRFLREADVVAGGRADVVYVWDEARAGIAAAPGSQGLSSPRLFLDGLQPALRGSYRVTLADGTEIGVRPVGQLLEARLMPWTFAHAASVTGLHPAQIEQFATAFCAAERPMILSSWGSNRYLHSDLMNRMKILILALRGKIGMKGAGLHSAGWISMEGFEAAAETPRAGLLGFALASLAEDRVWDDLVAMLARRKTLLEIGRELATEKMPDSSCATNNASINVRHAGMLAVHQDELRDEFPRPLSAYVDEAESKDWMPVYPPARKTPRAWFTGGNNVLRRTNMPQRMLETLWPQLELIVDLNVKLTTTGMHADYLLPCAGYYEKPNIKYPIAYVPYLHYGDAAVAPLGECKNEWELFWLLAQAVSREAERRDLGVLPGCGKRQVDLKQLHHEFSFAGTYGKDDAEAVTQQILTLSSSTRAMSTDVLKRTGIAKYTGTGMTLEQSQQYNWDWNGNGILQSLPHFVRDRWRWPTLTGRQQFYQDHPWFIEADEALPRHKDSPRIGGDEPFRFVSCHARWSVHSVWRDTPRMLRLQRGEPVVYLNDVEARTLGVADGGWVTLSNRHGEMTMRAKLSTAIQPGVAFYFHAWEPFQFPGHRSYKQLIPGPVKPLHYASGDEPLRWRFAIWEPGQHVQDTRVRIAPSPGPTHG